VGVTTWALGIDASLTHSGVVLGSGVPNKKKLEFVSPLGIKSAPKDHAHDIACLAEFSIRFLSVFEAAEDRMGAPGVLCLENYSFASAGRAHRSAELGGQIRLHAYTRGWTTIAVPPSSLKKWVAGHGHAEKNLMLQQILKRWGYTAINDNDGDAYALMRVGLYFAAQLAGEKVSEEMRQLFRKCEVYMPNNPLEIP
jgi:Holliday junction resolvasome RuvABC endonuclease subunit